MSDLQSHRKSLHVQFPGPHSPIQKAFMSSFFLPGVREIWIACGTKLGKAEHVEEMIPTTKGFKRMGDIRPGDYVFDEHGLPTEVLSTTGVMHHHECFRVTFSDGNSKVVDGDHDWVTTTHVERKNMARNPHTTKLGPNKRSTKEILDTLSIFMGGKLRPNHAIESVKNPVEYPHKDLPLDPYVLGVWLGDGTAGSGKINNPDPALREILEAEGIELNDWYADGGGYTVTGLTHKLREVGLLHNKHIPEEYLTAHPSARLRLIQGLMDTDGTISKKGACTFDNTNLNMAEGIEKLLWSFGIKTTRNQRYGKLNGVTHKLCYRINFTTDYQVFRLPSKACRLRKPASKTTRRYIVAVEPVESVPVKCITVANPSHLYLSGYFYIPTHNSLGCTVAQGSAVITGRNEVHRWVAPYYMQAKIGKRYMERMLPSDPWTKTREQGTPTILLPHLKSEIQFWHGNDPEALEGEGTRTNVLDECSKLKEEVYASVKTTTTFTGGKILGASTPRGKNWFYRRCMEAKREMEAALREGRIPEYIFLTAPTAANPFVPKGTIESARKNLPDRLFRQYFLAEFVDDSEVFVGFRKCVYGIVLDFPNQVRQEWFACDSKTQEVVIGVDWAKRDDYTVMTAWSASQETGKRVMCGFLRFTGVDYISAVKQLVRFAKNFKHVAVVWHDRTGVGDALDDMLARTNLPYDGIVFSQSSKATMVTKLIAGFQKNEVMLPHWPEMMAELEAYEITVSSLGTFKFSAPSGQHDDIVSSMILGYAAAEYFVAPMTVLTADDQVEQKSIEERWYDEWDLDD